MMDITISTKSATIPVYTAESRPEEVRGVLVMLWQPFTAFGVIIAFAMGVVFFRVGKKNWQYVVGSVFSLPLVFCLLIFLPPESGMDNLTKRNIERPISRSSNCEAI